MANIITVYCMTYLQGKRRETGKTDAVMRKGREATTGMKEKIKAKSMKSKKKKLKVVNKSVC